MMTVIALETDRAGPYGRLATSKSCIYIFLRCPFHDRGLYVTW